MNKIAVVTLVANTDSSSLLLVFARCFRSGAQSSMGLPSQLSLSYPVQVFDFSILTQTPSPTKH